MHSLPASVTKCSRPTDFSAYSQRSRAKLTLSYSLPASVTKCSRPTDFSAYSQRSRAKLTLSYVHWNSFQLSEGRPQTPHQGLCSWASLGLRLHISVISPAIFLGQPLWTPSYKLSHYVTVTSLIRPIPYLSSLIYKLCSMLCCKNSLPHRKDGLAVSHYRANTCLCSCCCY